MFLEEKVEKAYIDKADHVWIREINQTKIKGHSANLIIRDKQNNVVAVRCNCGEYHALIEDSETKTKRVTWFVGFKNQDWLKMIKNGKIPTLLLKKIWIQLT